MEKLKLAITMLVIMITIAASAQKPTIEWVDIPAGTFIMGSPKGEMEREKMKPSIR
jgi:formylglycine-generating enzyme required for sulfatase activity